VFQAIKEAKGTWIIGSNSNQNSIIPSQTLGSIVINLPRAFLIIAREVKKGNFTGHVFSLGLPEGVVEYTPNPTVANTIPAAVTAAADSAQQELMAGTFKGNVLPDSARKPDTK
jgi:basic membrane protein A and related proteins